MRGLLLCVFFAVAACAAPQLAPPPNLLASLSAYPDAGLPAHLRTATPQIFYVTDRTPTAGPGEKATYGSGRSRSMAFGTKTLSFGDGLSWEELKARSLGQGPRVTTLTALGAEELVRFPPTPLPFQIERTLARQGAGEAAAYARASKAFQDRITAELRRSNRREAIIYVHGVRNDFEDGADTIANLWHYSGRIGVPIVYTWPADNPGLLGYFTDRESSEFSVFHFKEMMRLLAEVPALEKIHVIAHSRGADLATTGLREMMIAARAAGRDPQRALKVKTLILAAPDLDIDVVGQRLVAEQFSSAVGQITVYMNGRDTALGLAQAVMRGMRLGRLRPSDIPEEDLALLAAVQRVHFVSVEEVSGGGSHGYFRRNPDVVSDIILTLRTGAKPGGSDRPLDRVAGNFWTMHKGYPFGRPKAVFRETARP
ncbi:MAG: alpha/beta hydrolase [Pseudomonadota bacterium]